MHKTLVVVDKPYKHLEIDIDVIHFDQYLAEYPKKNEPKVRVINLCDTQHYLSKGYYCSLLAEARKHHVLPSVNTINDLRDTITETELPTQPLPKNTTAGKQTNKIILFIYFGWTELSQYKKLASKLFSRFPVPILQITLMVDATISIKAIQRIGFSRLNKSQRELFLQKLLEFTSATWRQNKPNKRYRWEMAILVNPDETFPPSDKQAIKHLIKAADKLGIYAETITAKHENQIAEYDALFIRETTKIDHHSYRLARKAEQEGLVVIDDSSSILRCCNKVFLHDAFTYQNVPALKSIIISSQSNEDIETIEAQFHYPMILKIPESAFSQGVFKITGRDMLQTKLAEIFSQSALVLIQEYLYTDFDWRIGILNGRPIYACKYFMAQGHWQIYNHASQRNLSGKSQTLPTFETPKIVLDTAIKAAGVVGNGLYGVDIKQKGNRAYVIEVNDNPNIDHKIEDAYLGDELYTIIMAEFARRLNERGN